MRRVLIVIALVLSASVAQAQTPCTQTGQTFTCQTGRVQTLLWDYTEAVLPGDVFRVYVAGGQVGPDLPARTAAGISVQFGATLPAGSYPVAVSLVRPGAAIPEGKSQPVTLVLIDPPPPNPTPPGNLRIVEVIMRGKDLAGHVIWEHTAEMVVPAQ